MIPIDLTSARINENFQAGIIEPDETQIFRFAHVTLEIALQLSPEVSLSHSFETWFHVLAVLVPFEMIRGDVRESHPIIDLVSNAKSHTGASQLSSSSEWCNPRQSIETLNVPDIQFSAD
jgi:hypothetical protein